MKCEHTQGLLCRTCFNQWLLDNGWEYKNGYWVHISGGTLETAANAKNGDNVYYESWRERGELPPPF